VKRAAMAELLSDISSANVILCNNVNNTNNTNNTNNSNAVECQSPTISPVGKYNASLFDREQTHCTYTSYDTLMTAGEAKAFCRLRGQYMATICNRNEVFRVMNTVQDDSKLYWVGLLYSQAGWRWDDQSTCTFRYWSKETEAEWGGSTGSGSLPCLQGAAGALWQIANCSAVGHVVCSSCLDTNIGDSDDANTIIIVLAVLGALVVVGLIGLGFGFVLCYKPHHSVEKIDIL